VHTKAMEITIPKSMANKVGNQWGQDELNGGGGKRRGSTMIKEPTVSWGEGKYKCSLGLVGRKCTRNGRAKNEKKGRVVRIETERDKKDEWHQKKKICGKKRCGWGSFLYVTRKEGGQQSQACGVQKARFAKFHRGAKGARAKTSTPKTSHTGGTRSFTGTVEKSRTVAGPKDNRKSRMVEEGERNDQLNKPTRRLLWFREKGEAQKKGQKAIQTTPKQEHFWAKKKPSQNRNARFPAMKKNVVPKSPGKIKKEKGISVIVEKRRTESRGWRASGTSVEKLWCGVTITYKDNEGQGGLNGGKS